MIKALLLSMLLIFVVSADAVRVGVVVEFPDGGIFMKCVKVEENANAYEVMQKTDLAITWTTRPTYGHGLCAILDTGCQETGCVCKISYWNFYTKKQVGGWIHSSVGFDGGSSCQEHYCAQEGDLLGFTYDAYGNKPREISYIEVCPEETERIEEGIDEPGIVGRVIGFPGENAGFISAAVILLLLTAYFIYKPWEYF